MEMQVLNVFIVLAALIFESVIAKWNDSQSQVYVPFINGAFQHDLSVEERIFRQLDPIITITKSTTVVVACAKIVNVTGPCRRRRGYWREDPIVLSFDEETDKLTEILFSPVLSIEKTELPQMTVSDRVGRSVLSDEPAVRDDRLTSSLSSTSDQYVSSQPRINLKELFNFVGKLFSAFLPNKKPSSTISTSTSSSTTQSASSTTSDLTTTSTTLSTSSQTQSDPIFPQDTTTAIQDYWITITSTNTFFIQQCTPSPFPFSECLNSRRYSKTL